MQLPAPKQGQTLHTPLAAAKHISAAPEMPLTIMNAGLSATALP